MDRDLAIRNTHPTVVTVNAERDAWDKDGNVVVLDESKIAKEMTKLQAEHDNDKYQRDRKPLYGTWEQQLDMMYHGTWKDHVAKIKRDIPKENK
jgi:hypothetical protein|tara:strand:+ start:735 stop:1016 length:282 start_codon:yes stop_codon:yes gene_type:complete